MGKGFPSVTPAVPIEGLIAPSAHRGHSSCVQAGAWSGRRVGPAVSASEVERTVSAVAERALHHGARAGLDALMEAAVRLTETSGAALYAGGRRVALVGLEPPLPSRAHPLQLLKDGHTAVVLGEPCGEAADWELLSRLAVLGSALIASLAREESARGWSNL